MKNKGLKIVMTVLGSLFALMGYGLEEVDTILIGICFFLIAIIDWNGKNK